MPVEIDGDQGLASWPPAPPSDARQRDAQRASWVSLRFGGRIEVKDVQAMVQDLSGISRQMNVPIKALLGVNLLRHLNVTFDYVGGQFIVRSFAPPIPPAATRVPISYIKGGGMMMRSALSMEKRAPPASLLIDSSMSFPLALDQDGWKKAGTDVAKLTAVPQDSKLKQARPCPDWDLSTSHPSSYERRSPRSKGIVSISTGWWGPHCLPASGTLTDGARDVARGRAHGAGAAQARGTFSPRHRRPRESCAAACKSQTTSQKKTSSTPAIAQ